MIYNQTPEPLSAERLEHLAIVAGTVSSMFIELSDYPDIASALRELQQRRATGEPRCQEAFPTKDGRGSQCILPASHVNHVSDFRPRSEDSACKPHTSDLVHRPGAAVAVETAPISPQGQAALVRPDPIGFINKLMECWPEGDVDGGDLQEWALQFGILRMVTRTEPCGPACVCAESYDEPPYECNERVPLDALAAAPPTRAQELVTALRKLRNEASGFLAVSDGNAVGWTNARCLNQRITEADAVLARFPDAPDAQEETR